MNEIPHSGNSLRSVLRTFPETSPDAPLLCGQLSYRLKFIHDGAPFGVRLDCESATEFPARPGAEAAPSA